MKNFIRNIRKYKKIALICLGVLVLSVVAAVLVLLSRRNSELSKVEREGSFKGDSYMTDTDYPVYVEQRGQKLVITLDGSKSPDLNWEAEATPSRIVSVSAENEETKGTAVFGLTPHSTGYASVRFSQKSELGGVIYDAVNILADITVYTAEDNTMQMKISNIRQNTASSGALESGTPYLLSENRVIFPNGGDWTLTAVSEGALPEGLYMILSGTDDAGHSYYEVSMDTSKLTKEDGSPDMNALQSNLLLKSESLGVTKKLSYVMNDDREWTLVEEDS